MIDTHFYERLANWRRVYGDKPVRWRSPTDTFCRYAKCYFERAPGECYPISFARCTRFKRAQDDQIQRRRAFYSQIERWHTHAQTIAQRR